MLLASEFPISLLYLAKYTDFDFALTHKVLKNKKYAEFYKKQKQKGRFVICDNCLDYYSRVTLENGKQAYIGPIIKQKQKVKVLSVNLKTGKIEAQPITYWFEGVGKKTEWYKVITEKAKSNRSGEVGTISTADHKFWTKERGWVRAKNLKVGDTLISSEIELTNVQKQLILGSSLGDGSLMKQTNKNVKFTVGHSDKQLDYLHLKEKILESFMIKTYSRLNNIRGFNKRPNAMLYTITTKPLKQLRGLDSIFYKDRLKVYSKEALNGLTDMGLAFWYMDDGGWNKKDTSPVVVISLSSPISQVSKDNIVQYFLSIGLKSSISICKTRTSDIRLTFTAESSRKFFKRIAPYVLKSMQYKVPKSYRGETFWKFYDFKNSNNPTTERIKQIIKVPRSPKRKKYNITVAKNHNFFANNVLVSNSLFELGKAVSGAKLIQAIKIIEPSEIVAPDALGDLNTTIKQTLAFIKEYRTELKNIRIAAVLQGQNLPELQQCYKVYNSAYPLIKTVCIPFDIQLDETKLLNMPIDIRNMTNRLLVTEALDSQINLNLQHHLLGVSLPYELLLQTKYKWIRSADTSAPVMAGINHIDILAVSSKLIRIANYFEYKTDNPSSIIAAIERLKREIK